MYITTCRRAERRAACRHFPLSVARSERHRCGAATPDGMPSRSRVKRLPLHKSSHTRHVQLLTHLPESGCTGSAVLPGIGCPLAAVPADPRVSGPGSKPKAAPHIFNRKTAEHDARSCLQSLEFGSAVSLRSGSALSEGTPALQVSHFWSYCTGAVTSSGAFNDRAATGGRHDQASGHDAQRDKTPATWGAGRSSGEAEAGGRQGAGRRGTTLYGVPAALRIFVPDGARGAETHWRDRCRQKWHTRTPRGGSAKRWFPDACPT